MTRFSGLLAAILACVVASGAFAAPKILNYKGADAGRLVVSMSNPDDSMLTLFIERRDAPGAAELLNVPPFGVKWDFKGPQPAAPTGLPGFIYSNRPIEGWVTVESLPPGRYVIDHVLATDGFQKQRFHDLQIPFDVEAGKTTYLGEISTWALLAKSKIGLPLISGWRMTIRDQAERDLPLAKGRARGDLGTVTTQLPDAAVLGRLGIAPAP